MQQEMTGYQRMVSGVRRLQAAVRRGGGVGALVGLLLLPLGVGAVGSGDLDPSFGGDGTVTTSFGSGSSGYGPGPSGRRQDCGGRLCPLPVAPLTLPWRAICPTAPWMRASAAMARCSPTSGVAAMTAAYALALQPDGKIVVAGESSASGNGDFALARYLPNGTLDPSFGGDGRVLTDFGSGSYDGASALALQPDGKIVVAGYSYAVAS